MSTEVENGARLSVILDLRKARREMILAKNGTHSHEQLYRRCILEALTSGKEIDNDAESLALVQDVGAYRAAFCAIVEEFPSIIAE